MTLVLTPMALITFGLLSIKKLSDAKKGNIYNIYLSIFYLLFSIGLIVIVIYVLLSDIMSDGFYIGMVRLSTFLTFFSFCFPLFFLIGLKNGYKSISGVFIFTFFIGFALAILLGLFIGNFTLGENRKIIWEEINGKTLLITVAIIYAWFFALSSYILNKMIDQKLKKKFSSFIIGYSILIFIAFSLSMMNMQILEPKIHSIFLTIFTVPGGYLLYYGTGKKIE